jgi:hypothetical protein
MSGTLALGFIAALGAGLLLSSSLRNRSFSELLKGITSPNEGAKAEAFGEGEPAAVSGTPLTGNKAKFAAAFAKITGLSPQVVAAWLNHEQGSSTVEGGNNWLNVETGGAGGGSGPYGDTAREVERMSPEAAATYTAEWLKRYQPEILAAAGRGADAEVKAIEQSGYAASKYGDQPTHTFLGAA